MKAWHAMSFDAVESELKTSGEKGISRSEARQRLKRDGENGIFKAARGDLSFYFRKVVSNWLCAFMLFALIVLYFYRDKSIYLILALVTFLSSFVVFSVYVRSRRLLENMDEFSLPRAKVQRDGRIYEISQNYIARGDLILLSKGDIVPCDARIVFCENLCVRESGITGAAIVRDKDAAAHVDENAPIEKHRNMLYAASIIEEGRAYALCCEIGSNTAIARTKRKAKRPSFEGLRTMIMLRRVSEAFTFSLLPAVLLTFIYCLLPIPSADPVDGFILALAVALGVMSGFYTVFGTVMIAGCIYGSLGNNDKDRGAVIKNPSAIDRLADTDTVVMSSSALYDESELYLETVFAEDEEYPSEMDGEVVRRVLEIAAVAKGIYGTSRLALAGSSGSLSYEEDEILKALGRLGVLQTELSEKYRLVSHKKSDDESAELSVSMASGKDGDLLAVTGDIDKVISMCRYKRKDGRIEPISDIDREKLISFAYALTEGGHRIKAVASKSFNVKRFGEKDSQMVFEGLLSFRLKLLSSALEMAERCQKAGVSLMVFAPEREEALGIMRALGIANDKTLALSSERLSMMSYEILRTDIELYSLCYGLSGAEKHRVIKAMRANKRTVLFIGDSLSDIVLMRSSDSSVAFGSTLSGKNQQRVHYKAGRRDACDAMRFCADVIVSPPRRESGGFSSAVKVIERARNVQASVFKMLRYIISVSVARFIAVIFTVFTGITIMNGESALILSTVLDIAAVFSIAFESAPPLHKSKITREEIKHPITSSLRALLFGVIMGLIHVASAVILPYVMSTGSVKGIVMIEAVLFVPIILFETVREESVFTGELVLSVAYLLTAILAISLSLMLLVTSLPILLSIGSISGYTYIAAVIGVIIFFALAEIIKLTQ